LEWIKQNWFAVDQVMARKIIFDKIFNLILKISKLEAYEAIAISENASSSSSPVGSKSDFGIGAPSHSRTLGTTVHTGIANVAQRYHYSQQSLDFLAGRTGGNQSIEEEVRHYEHGSIIFRSSTDMIAYWMVRPCLKLICNLATTAEPLIL